VVRGAVLHLVGVLRAAEGGLGARQRCAVSAVFQANDEVEKRS
jgi:hypothetical protein